MGKSRKKNRHKRKKKEGTFDFVTKKGKKNVTRLGMIDWQLERLEKWQKQNHL